MAINSTTITVFLLTLTILNSLSFYKADNVLGSNERLYAGASLQYGRYVLTMQSDCNLVLYDGYPVWATNTGGRSNNCYCTMQSDGNLVVYNPYGNPIWASNTGRGQGYYVLVLHKDRNLVIYGSAIWAADSNAAYVDSVVVSVTTGNDNTTTIVHAGDTHGIPTKVDWNTTRDEILSSA